MYRVGREFEKWHSLHLTVVLLIILPQLIHCQLRQMTKCCPLDSNLKFQSDEHFECAPVNDKTLTLNSFNVGAPADGTSSFPGCSPKKVTKFFENGEKFAQLNRGCIDQTSSGDLMAIECPREQSIDVHRLNKCCPIGYSYDSNERFCTPNSDYLLNFWNVFHDYVILFDQKVPECSQDEAFVEYFSDVHDISFSQANLKVNGDVLQPDKFCVDGSMNSESETKNTEHIIVRSCQPRSVCDHIPCIRRCCKTDQMLQRKNGKTECVDHANGLMPIFYHAEFPIDINKTQERVHLKEYGVLHSLKCSKKYKLSNDEDDLEDKHFLFKNGSLFVTDTPYDVDSYCVENVKMANIEVHTFICFADEIPQPAKFHYYPIGLMISCVFLAMTLIVYLSLPKLLNLHGKTLVCYVISFLGAYALLATIQFNTTSRMNYCYEIAFVLLYFFMAVFAWQTVMCFDIWLTFGSLRSSFVMRHNKRNQRKFWYYSIYAWGMPMLWTLFAISAEKFHIFPTGWNPTVGQKTCFFSSTHNWKEHFLYFLLPAGCHVLINSVLFIITAIHCSRVKNEIHRMQYDTDDSSVMTRRQKFLASKAMFVFTLNLKLFTVMGISWILEIISTYNDNQITETLTDIYNIFLGVFIFFIFVFKRKVIHEFKCRIGIMPKSTGSATPRSTTTTHTTNIAMKDMSSTSRISGNKGVNELPLLTSSINNIQKVN